MLNASQVHLQQIGSGKIEALGGIGGRIGGGGGGGVGDSVIAMSCRFAIVGAPLKGLYLQ